MEVRDIFGRLCHHVFLALQIFLKQLNLVLSVKICLSFLLIRTVNIV